MECSKLRYSGELSDITVVIQDKSYCLHKFPLYARCGFFFDVAKKSESRITINLDDFPGGQKVFELVIDFCYNINVDISKENVIEVLYAARWLRMSGEGNLEYLTEKLITDIITSAKLTRCNATIIDLLQHCALTDSGILDKGPGVVEQCIDALIECWTKTSSVFVPRSSTGNQIDANVVEALVSLPEDWIVKILSKGKAKAVNVGHLVNLAVSFLSQSLQTVSVEKAKIEDIKKSEVDEEANSALLEQQTSTQDTSKIARLLDRVLLELPEKVCLAEYATPTWIVRCLKVATVHRCKCFNILIKAAGEIFKSLSPDDLCVLPPAIIHDLIKESVGLNPNKETYSSSCALVELYLQILKERGELTSKSFKLLASTVPTEHREFDDQLYVALETVLRIERDQLSVDARKELISAINIQRVEDTTLQRALEEGLFPARLVAEESLRRCKMLRAQITPLAQPCGTGNQADGVGQSRAELGRLEQVSRSGLSWNDGVCDNSLGTKPASCYFQQTDDGPSQRDSISERFERNLGADLDSVPVRVRAVSSYMYRPIFVDYGEPGVTFGQTYRSVGNIRTYRPIQPAVRPHRSFRYRIT